MSAICIFDAGAGGPGYPAPGGASPRQKFLGPAPGKNFQAPPPPGPSPRLNFQAPPPPGQAPPGAGFAGARPRAPEDLDNKWYDKHL